MSEMIDKVAEALWKKRIGNSLDIEWDNLFPRTKQMYIDEAKAAIEAMREPTEKMYKAASYILTAQSGVYGPDDIWASMIDEALK